MGNSGFSFVTTKDGPVYQYNTAVPKSDDGQNTGAIQCIGVYKAGDTVSGSYSIIDEATTDEQMMEFCANVVFAVADNDVLKEYAGILKRRDVTLNVNSNTDLTGTFTAEAGQRLLFTLPWDGGWSCYIDGQKVPVDRTWDLFMSVEAPEGQHTYEMKFFPEWMTAGIYISGFVLAGLAAFAIVWMAGKKKRRAAAAPREVVA